MKIIMCEFVNEFETLLARYGKDFFVQSDIKVVCLNPKVRAHLKSQGVEVESTLPYFNNDAHQRIILRVERITQALLKDFVFEDKLGIREAYLELIRHHLRLKNNHFSWILEILNAIKQKHQPHVIYAAVAENEKTMYTDNPYIKSERFLGLLTRDFCKAQKIKFEGTIL